MIVGGTTFVAFSQDTGLPQIESSLQAQNALTKVLAGLGSIDAETARKILAKKKSYLAWLRFGSQDDNDADYDECDVDDELDIASSSVDENADTASDGRFYMSRRHHLPSDMCTGYIPSGLKCLLNIIPVQYRTLIFLCVELEGLMFRLLLKALGGKVPIGPNTRLPIDANGASTCGGLIAIGRFAAGPCACKKGGAQMNMFKATDQTDPLFGHLLCKYCLELSHKRLKTITAEVEALGLDINRITKHQSQIYAIIDTFNKDSTLVATVEVMKHVMQQNGLPVSDDNLVKLLSQWAVRTDRSGPCQRRVYTVRPYDVLPTAYGTNTVFQGIIDSLKPYYYNKSPAYQTAVVDHVLKEWRAKRGRFMTETSPGSWEEMNANSARERCIQAFNTLQQQQLQHAQLPLPSPLPSPWQQHTDPSTGKLYYYNPTTRESQWNRPTLLRHLG